MEKCSCQLKREEDEIRGKKKNELVAMAKQRGVAYRSGGKYLTKRELEDALRQSYGLTQDD